MILATAVTRPAADVENRGRRNNGYPNTGNGCADAGFSQTVLHTACGSQTQCAATGEDNSVSPKGQGARTGDVGFVRGGTPASGINTDSRTRRRNEYGDAAAVINSGNPDANPPDVRGSHREADGRVPFSRAPEPTLRFLRESAGSRLTGSRHRPR